VTLQNGLGNREIIADIIGDPLRVIQGVTSHGSYMVESGHVWHTGEGDTTLAFQRENSQMAKEVAEILGISGIPCKLTDNLDGMLWGKLIVNAGINPLTALFKVKNGVVATSEVCREILSKTVKEGVEVASARGILSIYGSN
jgi:2-dehydropantoate 2-reductase